LGNVSLQFSDQFTANQYHPTNEMSSTHRGILKLELSYRGSKGKLLSAAIDQNQPCSINSTP
jgi:hypothetical protein